MAALVNRQWRVARYPRPDEVIGPQHFAWTSEAAREPADGEFLVRTLCLAPVPAQRGYLEKSHHSFLENLPVGEVMRGRGVGQIIASRHPDYRVGEIFVGSLGWQDYSIQRPRGAEFVFSTKKVSHPTRPLSSELGVLGQAGATAYFGLLDVGALKPGDNVLVSAAAGGVGSVAGQIARIRGAKCVVGTAGSDAKCRWLREELGFHATINYRTENVGERLAELFPDGIDVFFDNVGGEILNAALGQLAMRARVVICGFIASDYTPGPARRPDQLPVHRLQAGPHGGLRGVRLLEPLRRGRARPARLAPAGPAEDRRGHRRRPREDADVPGEPVHRRQYRREDLPCRAGSGENGDRFI